MLHTHSHKEMINQCTDQDLFGSLIISDQLRNLIHFVHVSSLMKTGTEEPVQHMAHERPLHPDTDRHVCKPKRKLFLVFTLTIGSVECLMIVSVKK